MNIRQTITSVILVLMMPVAGWTAPTTRCPIFDQDDIDELIALAIPTVDWSWDRNEIGEEAIGMSMPPGQDNYWFYLAGLTSVFVPDNWGFMQKQETFVRKNGSIRQSTKQVFYDSADGDRLRLWEQVQACKTLLVESVCTHPDRENWNRIYLRGTETEGPADDSNTCSANSVSYPCDLTCP